jgi:hypothetical protein
MERLAVIAICVSALLSMACEDTIPASTPSTIEAPLGSFVQPSTGFTFPETVGSFERVAVDKYDESGDDISVGYNSLADLIVATVYVYPADSSTPPGSLPSEEHFVGVKSSLEASQPGSTLVIDETTANIGEAFGRKATYRLQAEFAGENRTVLSDVYLFGLDNSFIKYRFTYPESEADSAAGRIAEFMELLQWP